MGDLNCIRMMSLFEDLSESELEKVAALAGWREYDSGETLFMEGDPADRLFVVKYGHVKLYKVSEDGRELILEFMQKNSVIGEDSVFANQTYSATAVALAPTCVSIFKEADMERLFLDQPAIAVKVIRQLSRKLYQSTEQVSGLAFQDARGRVISTLLRLAAEHGRFTQDGLVIDLPLTHQELANMVSLNRTTVTTILLQLRQEGLVAVDQRRISLLDRTRLQHWAS